MNHRDSKTGEDQDERNEKQDKSVLDGKDVSKDHNENQEEQAIVNEEVVLDNRNDPDNSKLSNDQAPGSVQESDGSTSKAEVPASFEGLGEGTSIKEPAEKKDGHAVSDSLPSEKNEREQPIISNETGEEPKSVKTPKDVEMVSGTVHSVGERMEKTGPVMNVDMVSNSLVSEKNESLPMVTSVLSQNTGTEKNVDMMSSSVPLVNNEPPHLVASKSGPENGGSSGLTPSHPHPTQSHTPTSTQGM